MKNLIIRVLNRHADRQLNLASEKCRDTLAAEIEVVLESKGFYIVYTEDELVEQETRASWVCSICGENTFEVDCDYIGSGTNHLGCELEKGQKDDTPVPVRERGPDRRKSDRRDGAQTVDESDGITYKEAEYVAGFASDTHSEFVTDDVVEKVFDYATSYKTTDGHRKYPYNSFVKSKEDIQKQSYASYVSASANEIVANGLPRGGDAQAVRDSNKLAEEIVDDKNKKYIYESPDGGETIYKREFGNDKRRKLSFPELVNLKGEIKNEND